MAQYDTGRTGGWKKGRNGMHHKIEVRLKGEDVLWEAKSTLFLIIFRLTDFVDRQQEVMLKSY